MARVVLAFFLASQFSAASAEVAECEDVVDDENTVLLLQTGAGLQRQGLAAKPRYEQPSPVGPLAWLHVPKTGSTILNALVRLPGLCPGLAEPFDLHEAMASNWDVGSDVTEYVGSFDQQCPGLFPSVGSHQAVGSNFESHYSGKGVIMLRQPEQRIISAQNMYLSLFYPNASSASSEYAVSGCTVRMLVDASLDGDSLYRDCDGSGEAPCSHACMLLNDKTGPPPPPPSAADVSLAQERLRTFAFVGITEEWQLSMCLFHAIFGGECSEDEFQNTRPGAATVQSSGGSPFAAPAPYDTGVLDGWVDTEDRVMYETGQEIFQQLLDDHGVSHTSCEPCYQAAGVI